MHFGLNTSKNVQGNEARKEVHDRPEVASLPGFTLRPIQTVSAKRCLADSRLATSCSVPDAESGRRHLADAASARRHLPDGHPPDAVCQTPVCQILSGRHPSARRPSGRRHLADKCVPDGRLADGCQPDGVCQTSPAGQKPSERRLSARRRLPDTCLPDAVCQTPLPDAHLPDVHLPDPSARRHLPDTASAVGLDKLC